MKLREGRIFDHIEIPKMVEIYNTDLSYYKSIEGKCLSLLEQENGVSKVSALKEGYKKDKVASKIINDILLEEGKRFSKQMDEQRALRIRNKLLLKDDNELASYQTKKHNDEQIRELVREEMQCRWEEKNINLQLNQKLTKIIDSYQEKVVNSQLKKLVNDCIDEEAVQEMHRIRHPEEFKLEKTKASASASKDDKERGSLRIDPSKRVQSIHENDILQDSIHRRDECVLF